MVLWKYYVSELFLGLPRRFASEVLMFFSGLFYEFVNKNKKPYNFETAEGRNFKFTS